MPVRGGDPALQDLAGLWLGRLGDQALGANPPASPGRAVRTNTELPPPSNPSRPTTILRIATCAEALATLARASAHTVFA